VTDDLTDLKSNWSAEDTTVQITFDKCYYMMETTSDETLRNIKRRELKVALVDNDSKLPLGAVWTVPVAYDKENQIWNFSLEKLGLNELTLRLDSSFKNRLNKTSVVVECLL